MASLGRLLSRIHHSLHTDFCPDANRWVHWMKHPLACLGVAAVIALACGLLVNSGAFAVFGLLATVGLLGAIWPRIAVAGLRCEVEFGRNRARPGEVVPVLLRIENRRPWPVWGLSLRRGFVDGTAATQGIALARVGGWSRAEYQWDFRPERRGTFPFEAPQVDTAFPFGLLHCFAPVSVRGELLVWPASVRLDGMPDAAEIQTREERFADRRIGDAGDILGTRPFREGDALRRVHWRQTARYGRLIVTERQAPAACAMRLIVDASAPSHTGNTGRATLESLLSTAASILEGLHRQHALVEVVVGSETFLVGAAANDLRRALDALARVPVSGIADHLPHGAPCALDCRTRLVTSMTITTDCAFARHLAHRHGGSQERYVLVHGGDCRHQHGHPVAGCDCHSWLDLSANEPLDEVLPGRWRRSCHVA